MTQTRSVRLPLAAIAAMLAACEGTSRLLPPPVVATVAITAPPSAPSFATVGRTVQLSAEARDSDGVAIPAFITWTTSNALIASVNASGLVTAAGNGTAQVRAHASGIASAPLSVTVLQVPVALVIAPSSPTFGALGSARQLVATLVDSGGAAAPTGPVTWTVFAHPPPFGPTVSVSPSGVLTALQNTTTGMADTVQAAVVSGTETIFQRVIVATVTQVVASVVITVPAGDSVLHTTTRTRQFGATALDSNGNATTNATMSWTSQATGVATVSGTGLVTAVGEGFATIQATAQGPTSGGLRTRPQVVQLYADTFQLAPTSGTVAAVGGSVTLTGTAKDSVGGSVPIAWTSRNPAVVTVSASSGTTVAASHATNVFTGAAFVVMSADTKRDSAAVTLDIPVSFASNVQPIFTANCALAGCHTSPSPQEGLNLSSGQAFANLVNVAATSSPTPATRVIPGDPNNSYVIRKLEGGPNISGSRMPFGAPPLSQTTINIIRSWITQGAVNN